MVESPQMSAEQEVKDNIHKNWIDHKVADWVIKNLPLLEYGNTHSQCPVFELDLSEGLSQTNLDIAPAGNFKEIPKIVISGGFEGTLGHLEAINNLWEIRALTSSYNKSQIVVMLEPDSYILQRKQRDPLVNLQQRTELWSTSGLVDVVIILPEVKSGKNVSEHYSKVHEYITPASWCTNIENPHWNEIVIRDGLRETILNKMLMHHPSVHTSFLHSTKNLNTEESKYQLAQYILNLVKRPDIYNVAFGAPPLKIAEAIFSELVEGL